MKKRLIKTILLIVLLLLAIVLGILIGDVCAGMRGLSWLAAGASFGLQPATVDLSVIQLTFGLTVSINVAQAILLLIAILAYCAIRVKD